MPIVNPVVMTENMIPNNDIFSMVFYKRGNPERKVLTHNQIYGIVENPTNNPFERNISIDSLNVRFLMLLNQNHYKIKDCGEKIKFIIDGGNNTIRTGLIISYNTTKDKKSNFYLILSEFQGAEWVYCVPERNIKIIEKVAA